MDNHFANPKDKDAVDGEEFSDVEFMAKFKRLSNKMNNAINILLPREEISLDSELHELALEEENLLQDVDLRKNRTNNSTKQNRPSKNNPLPPVLKGPVAPGAYIAPQKFAQFNSFTDGSMHAEKKQLHQCRKSIEEMLRKCKDEALARVAAFDCSSTASQADTTRRRTQSFLPDISRGNRVSQQPPERKREKVRSVVYSSIVDLHDVGYRPAPPQAPRGNQRYESRRQRRMREHANAARKSNHDY